METIKEYLIQSSSIYYNFLSKNNLGFEEIRIQHIRLLNDGKIVLALDKDIIISTDYTLLFINEVEINLEEYATFSKKTKTLIVEPDEKLLSNILGNSGQSLKEMIEYNASRIMLFSDLKFLVFNILEFCEQDLEHVTLPTTKSLDLLIDIPSFVSDKQRVAIKGIFCNPISYIWGISGSGKTQVVLCLSAINIMLQDKKLLILAPTNTALEQIFSSIIPLCEQYDIRRYKFLRLGMASHEFKSNFPEACIHNEENKENGLFSFRDLKSRLQDCLAIGATLDTFVKQFKILRELDFAHIFLDECAFSPLIKLIVPLSLNIPITLLGDHKQLMPICKMPINDIKQDYHSVCAWSLNTLFIEELLHNPQNLHNKNNHDNIHFKNIRNFKLNVTHRYGDNLARILDIYVYANNLAGLGDDTKIYYVDVERYHSHEGDNVHYGEVIAIENIAHSLSKGKDYAILTPFRAQQSLLIGRGLDKSRVFTIHRSQGKEFDLVILSPVKLHYHLTDTRNKSALFTLNVAISRLKKELIIVCDYNFWIRQKGQLLQSILQIAQPYNMDMKGLL